MASVDDLSAAAARFASEAQSFGHPITCILVVVAGPQVMRSVSFPKDEGELMAAVLGLDEVVEKELPALFPAPPKRERPARKGKR